MSDYVLLRLLDSFFRHKVLHILPLVAFTALGAWFLMNEEVEYRSKGVLLVEDETLLTSLSGVGGDGNGFQSPADRTSVEVNALLQTDAFVRDVAAQAGLGTDVTPLQIEQLRASIGAYPAGENLVHVWSNDTDPTIARDKAAATIDGLIQFQVDTAVVDSSAAEGVLDPLTRQYRADLTAARDALAEYLEENKVRGDKARPPDEQLRVDQLTAAVAQADARYTDALGKEESARLARTQAESAIQGRFQVVDQPQAPLAPMGQLRSRVLALAVFVLVGATLAAASVLLSAVLDKSVRYPLDVTARLDANVLGVIPDTSRWRLPAPGRTGAADQPEATARRRRVAP